MRRPDSDRAGADRVERTGTGRWVDVTEPGARTVTGKGAVAGDGAGAERAGRADWDWTVGGRDGAQEYPDYEKDRCLTK